MENMEDMESIALRFEPYQDEEKGVIGEFVPVERQRWEDYYDEFYSIEDHAVRKDDSLPGMLEIIKKEPSFLDAYAHIGGRYLDLGTLDLAEKYYGKGLQIASSLIPSDFSGTIPWSHLDNRPFLRLHCGIILCHLRNSRYKKAVKLMEQHLVWDPNDNIGVRYLIGDACIQSNMTGKAKKYLSENQQAFPPAAYSLALLAFRKKDYIEAATALRRGIAQNPYIAEYLTGRIKLTPHIYWHGTDMAGPETAIMYMENGGLDIWQTTPGAVDFCDWLFNYSAVLKERSEIARAREGLTVERNIEKRGQYVDLQSKIMSSIDNLLSERIIKKATDRSGEEKWPWLFEKDKNFFF